MPKIDENEIIRRLKLLSQIEPNAEATNRVMQRLQNALMKEESEPESAATKIMWAIFNRSLIKFAAAALLICAGFLIGRIWTHQSVDVESLRAEIVNQINRQWQSVFETRCVQLKEEVYRQAQADLAEFAAQTLAASRTLTDKRVAELIQLIEAARMQDQQRIAAALEQIELNRLKDKNQFRNGLETLVARASETSSTTQN